MKERLRTNRFDTLHVNLWGCPGVGKSALSSRLHGRLMAAGYRAVLVQDYAAELALQGKLAWRDVSSHEIHEFDQFLISSEQYRRQSEFEGLAEVVICDAPLLQQLIFAPENYRESLCHMINELTIGWTSLDVMLESDIRSDYSSSGRVQSAEESMALYPEIMQILRELRPNFLQMYARQAEDRLVDIIASHLRG